MTMCYKLLKKDLTAYGEYQYTPGVTARVKYTGELCSSGVLHVYDTPEDAVFFDPIHAGYLPRGILWECEYEGPSVSDGTKRGVGELTLIREIPVPTTSAEARVERAIHAALEVCQDEAWRTWALRWLDGSDRSAESARSAELAAAAAESAELAEAAWAVAAEAAAEAAWQAAWQATTAWAAAAARSAAWAAAVAWAVAESAVRS